MSERAAMFPAPREIWMSGGMPYPLVIFLTRYSGTYEGGTWAALNREEIPQEATADDVTCSEFWGEVGAHNGVLMDKYGEVVWGVGDTPDSAIAHCVFNAKAYNNKLLREEGPADE